MVDNMRTKNENSIVWKNAKKEFPEFNKTVIGFYTIGEFKYFTLCYMYEIVETQHYKEARWYDNGMYQNEVQPLFWTELPYPPELE